MSASGAALIVIGTWVLCQVLGGNALGRLGITARATDGTGGSGKPDILAPGPNTGTPVPGLGGG